LVLFYVCLIGAFCLRARHVQSLLFQLSFLEMCLHLCAVQLAAKAFPATKSWASIEHWVKVLCGELADRMAEDSDLHSRRPKNLVVQYRRADGNGRFGAGTERSKYATSPLHWNTSHVFLFTPIYTLKLCAGIVCCCYLLQA
jgi:hypothetical protein